MKVKGLVWSFCVIIMVFCGEILQAQKNNYTIRGTVEGLKKGKVYFYSEDVDPGKIDSVRIRNGRFLMKVHIDTPAYYFLRIDTLKSQLAFFMDKGNLVIKAYKDSLYKTTIIGSSLQDQWQEWAAEWTGIRTRAGIIYRMIDSATKGGKPLDAETRKKSDSSFALLSQDTKEKVMAFINKYPASPVAPFIIIDRFINYPDQEMVTKTYAALKEEAKNSVYGKKIGEYIRISAKTAIGASPDFSLADTSGKQIRLSELKGQYVLVDFWASWCVPCRKENPNVVNAYNKYHSKGFEILGISLDTDRNAWLKAIHADNLDWKHVSDLKGWQSALVNEYGIKVVPTNFLLNKEGKIVAQNLRGEALQEVLAELMR